MRYINRLFTYLLTYFSTHVCINQNVSITMCELCFFWVKYLAPDILLKKPYDRMVDWWCLGAVLYEMLFGLVSS